MYDVNVEHFGWNKESNENVSEYVKRVWNDDYLETVQNNAFCDMTFDKSMDMNDICPPIEGCYYFSYTTGIKEKVSNNHTQVETCQEVKNFTNDVIGFDVQKVNRLQWQDIPREKGKETLFGKFSTLVKQACDPLFTYCNFYIQHHQYDIPSIVDSQKEDKNWDSLKWDKKRWHGDNDTLVSRVSQEFPRISHKYTKFSSECKPWGKKDPEQFNWEDNTKLNKFDKGRWFFTAIENSTHLDYCGWPDLAIIKHVRCFFGTENKFQFSKYLFERLYSLECN